MVSLLQAQLRVEELLKEYSEERDKKRAALDQAFTPDEAGGSVITCLWFQN